ncbi:GLPGLI family protein [Chryseobacterium ginsenosidimutans]|uniref:GLPGLI family protein n=1 Tax=Chryseobacterium geocarposphaerae TaxID=1416776 RepID=A0ABU1L9X7_9FLAO|nr:GLPGLI family protein [Chryseobacterium geocarposphaerae]MDR6697077.1 GLPGLI family protein [Chryseobacterium ginsenosidimutans]
MRSPIATLHEDLYIKGNQVISIQDSILSKPNNPSGSEWMAEIGVTQNNGVSKAKKLYFISNIDTNVIRKFFFNSAPYSMKDQTMYFIYDEVSRPVWKIEENSTRTILKYKCIKATTSFRGSNITAYFTRELPYSAGPFKFFGLPGLILDVRVDGKSYDMWKVEKIELDDKTVVNFKPQFKDAPKISMKQFVKINDDLSRKFNEEMLKNMPEGTKIENIGGNRIQMEKLFEWEKETVNN